MIRCIICGGTQNVHAVELPSGMCIAMCTTCIRTIAKYAIKKNIVRVPRPRVTPPVRAEPVPLKYTPPATPKRTTPMWETVFRCAVREDVTDAFVRNLKRSIDRNFLRTV